MSLEINDLATEFTSPWVQDVLRSLPYYGLTNNFAPSLLLLYLPVRGFLTVNSVLK